MRAPYTTSARGAFVLLGALALLFLLGGGCVPAEASTEHAAGADAPAAPGHAAPPAGEGGAGPEGGGHGGGHEGGHEERPPELPNLIHLLYVTLGGEEGTAPGWLNLLYRFQDVFFAVFVALLIILIVRLGTRRMALIPGGAQNVVEMFIDTFRTFILGILGPAGERYVPFLGSLFVYIWFMNLIGLVPLMKSPTSSLSTTAALAVCVFLYVQSIGIRQLGVIGYLRHLAGDPQDAIGWGMVPLMLPLHIIGELAKPVSLSLRLFGNILGEDVLIGVFAILGVGVLAFTKLPVGLPLQLPFVLLALLMSTVQALVFTLLSTIYITQMLPHDEGHDAADGEKAAPGAGSH
jgi:F-type H+-transporting ATPase subunit a